MARSIGALSINKGMTSTIGMIGKLKGKIFLIHLPNYSFFSYTYYIYYYIVAATMQVYVFARSIATGGAAADAGRIAAGVSNICSHLLACMNF